MKRLNDVFLRVVCATLFTLTLFSTAPVQEVEVDCHSYGIGAAEAMCEMTNGCSIGSYYSYYSRAKNNCEIAQALQEL